VRDKPGRIDLAIFYDNLFDFGAKRCLDIASRRFERAFGSDFWNDFFLAQFV